jgi:hypothetical protein
MFADKPKAICYVPHSVVDAMAQINLNKCPLFRWMCTMFPENRVREVWKMYNVTTDSKGNAVFWYTDAEGRIAFDKRIGYKADGHRDKSYFPAREYRTADGFTARPYFGAHLVVDGEVNICESEKTCLIATLALGGTWLATGGKGNLKDATNAKLYPDKDAYDEWSRKGECIPWFKDWSECGETSDIGDYIVWKLINNQNN